MNDKKVQYKSTREAVLGMINDFLGDNPGITPEGFGWSAVKDSTIVERLSKGRDITTRKLDMILHYLKVHSKPQTEGQPHV